MYSILKPYKASEESRLFCNADGILHLLLFNGKFYKINNIFLYKTYCRKSFRMTGCSLIFMINLKKLKQSFKYAYRGFVYVFKNEQNFRLQLLISGIVIFFMIFFKVNRKEATLLVIIIMNVLVNKHCIQDIHIYLVGFKLQIRYN